MYIVYNEAANKVSKLKIKLKRFVNKFNNILWAIVNIEMENHTRTHT